MTPTYSGCPATAVINLDIEKALRAHGVDKLRLERRLSPPWTTDWMSEDGRDASCANTASRRRRRARTPLGRLPALRLDAHAARQPVRLDALQGATIVCEDCLEPFDYFKCI